MTKFVIVFVYLLNGEIVGGSTPAHFPTRENCETAGERVLDSERFKDGREVRYYCLRVGPKET